MSELDNWLNEGLSESVAKAEAGLRPPAQPAPETTLTGYIDPAAGTYINPSAPAPPAAAGPQGPKSLSSMGITKGGVIRNPNTKRRTQTNNPVTNPRAPSKTVKAPTPEEDLRADNPALAFPTLMTGMDVDAMKPRNGAVEQPPPAPASAAPPPAPPPPVPSGFNYQSTVAQLLERAIKNGGTYIFSNEHIPTATSTFVIAVEVRPRASKAPA
jgi:hypothetical protein